MPIGAFPLTVAVVDDDPKIRQLLQEEIEYEGHHVLSFESAEAFLDDFQKQKVDLVLLDLMMPGMDGLQCLQKLHSQPISGSLPRVIVVSALNDSNKQSEVFKAGADGYVVKPDIFEKLPSLLSGSNPQ